METVDIAVALTAAILGALTAVFVGPWWGRIQAQRMKQRQRAANAEASGRQFRRSRWRRVWGDRI